MSEKGYKKYILGTLLILVAFSIIYISLNNTVRMRVDQDKTTFYVKLLDNNGEPYGRWLVSGREYNFLMDGTSKMHRDVSNIKVNIFIDKENNHTTITRITPYKRGPIIIDTYEFDGNTKDVKIFPVSHKIRIINGSNYFYRYEVKDLDYGGVTKKLIDETELSFGMRMKLTLQEDYRWAWIYKDGLVRAQYNIASDDEVFNIRLFDPVGTYCYQETATIATSCGGLNTGSYASEGNFWSVRPATNIYDGDYGSYGEADASEEASVFVNYTKPYNSTIKSSNESVWQSAIGLGATITNHSIPSSCWNLNPDKLSFKLTSDNININSYTYCLNSTGWELVFAETGSFDEKVYEEGMWWYMVPIIPYDLTITDPTTGNPATKSEGENLSINFTFNNGTNNITSNIDLINITIEGVECPVVNNTVLQFCDGTADACSTHSDEPTCDYDAGCNWAGGIAYTGWGMFGGTETTNGADLNAVANTLHALEWSSQAFDTDAYSWDVGDPERITIDETGTYHIVFHLPIHDSDYTGINNNRFDIESVIKINGVVAPVSAIETSYIRGLGGDNHFESSNSYGVILELTASDYLEIFSGNEGGDITEAAWTEGASVFIEKIEDAEQIFYAYGIQSTSGTTPTDLNQDGLNSWTYDMEWISVIKDGNYTHTDDTAGITISDAGSYYISASIPTAGTASRQAIALRIELDDVEISGSRGSQGYIRFDTDEGNDRAASQVSMIIDVGAGEVLTVGVSPMSDVTGVVIVYGNATLSVIKIDDDVGAFKANATALKSGNDWNTDAPGTNITYETADIIDTNYFSHSSNSELITVLADGIYLFSFIGPETDADNIRTAQQYEIWVNGVIISNSRIGNTYNRLNGQIVTSGAGSIALNLSENDEITITSRIESDSNPDGIVNLVKQGTLSIWYKGDPSEVAGACSGTADDCGTYNASQTNCERVNCDFTDQIGSYQFGYIGNDIWQANCTVPSCTGDSDLYVEAEYTTESEVRNDTQTNSVSCEGGLLPDINLSFGPAGVTIFRWIGCGPDFENVSSFPEKQNTTRGIDYVCNNGSATGDVEIKMSGSLNTGWSISASSTSQSAGYIDLTTSYQDIKTSLTQDTCSYIWFKANCSYVTETSGGYEIYTITSS